MSTVITVANNTGFRSIINPFLPITHLLKNQSISWFLAAKQTQTSTKQISRNIKTIHYFILLRIFCLFQTLRNNWYHKCSGSQNIYGGTICIGLVFGIRVWTWRAITTRNTVRIPVLLVIIIIIIQS